MLTQIKLRRDAAADWTSNDPTLVQAEIGIETDTNKLKIGDGSTAWTSLDYPYYLASEVDTISGDIDTVIDGDITTHAALPNAHHNRSHAITGTSDHTAGNWKAVYTDGSGDVQELALSTSGTVLSSNGASVAPSFIDHGGLAGLTDDDHTQYILADGSRSFSGSITANASGTLNLGSLATPFDNVFCNTLNITDGFAPATSSSTGTQGDVAWDSGFIYICTNTNTWERVAIASW